MRHHKLANKENDGPECCIWVQLDLKSDNNVSCLIDINEDFCRKTYFAQIRFKTATENDWGEFARWNMSSQISKPKSWRPAGNVVKNTCDTGEMLIGRCTEWCEKIRAIRLVLNRRAAYKHEEANPMPGKEKEDKKRLL